MVSIASNMMIDRTANYFSQTPLQQTGFYQAQQAAAGSALQVLIISTSDKDFKDDHFTSFYFIKCLK
jgi:hypothetical protein